MLKTFLKIQQSNKISILETVELVRERAHVDTRVFERKLEVKLNGAISAVLLNLP